MDWMSFMKQGVIKGCLVVMALAALPALSEPIRDWDWHMPATVYKELEFTDRAGVDRAVKVFQQAIDAERRGVKVTEQVPRYRLAAGEWRKVQVQGETTGGNEGLMAYSIFMQGYAKQQAHDRNEAIKHYEEILDLYPEQRFISIPARYMLSVVKREMGDTRAADNDIEAIVDDQGADGHPIYYNVVYTYANLKWSQGDAESAIKNWEKIVFSKAKPNATLRLWARDKLIFARIATSDFDRLEEILLLDIPTGRKADRARELLGNAIWMSSQGHSAINEYLTQKYPKEKQKSKRESEFKEICNGYADWMDHESGIFDGVDDGWLYALATFYARYSVDSKKRNKERIQKLTQFVRNAKDNEITGRAQTLVSLFLQYNENEDARNVAALPKNTLDRLHLQYSVESRLFQWKMAVMYLEQFIANKPPQNRVISAKYDLAAIYHHRLGQSDKAIKIYLELDEPPKTLWFLADVYRDCGRKKDAYQMLTEIISMFPPDAPNAVLRMGGWKEADGDKEKAISLYRSLMNHPEWKQTGASSAAHQALERLGIATGGAMTNEVR